MKKAIVQFLYLSGLVCCSVMANENQDMKTGQQLAHGEKMHKEHCYKCHTEAVYTRENHFVKSLEALSKQVVRCKDNTSAPWFDEDTEAVVHFLNEKYYKF